MPSVVRVADQGDPRIAEYRNVPDAELLERSGLFIAEGRLVVRRLLTASRFTARSVMVTETALASLADALERVHALPVYVVPQALMNGITGLNIHRGCLAVGQRRPIEDWRTLVPGATRIVMLERVANADNVGAIFRNAAAFATDAILLDPASTDPLYRKAIRTSMGAALAMPFARAIPWRIAPGELRTAGITLVALSTEPSASRLADLAGDLRGRRIAIVLGHEGEGLTPETLEACDHRARIPMAPGVDSLNVATAAAVALYELAGDRGTRRTQPSRT